MKKNESGKTFHMDLFFVFVFKAMCKASAIINAFDSVKEMAKKINFPNNFFRHSTFHWCRKKLKS